MVSEVLEQKNVTFPIQQYDFGQLLKGRIWITVGSQIIFNKNGTSYITNINNNLYKYTVEDYRQLPEGAPYQLINGKLVFMPSPFEIHQGVLANLHLQVGFYVKNKKLGIVRFAPLDVHFDKENTYQPDLLFVSNNRKHIVKKHIYGAPDLVVEIPSKGTKNLDEEEKMEVYGKFYVLEYWLINPNEQSIEIYDNVKGIMKKRMEIKGKGIVQSKAIEGFSFELGDIW